MDFAAALRARTATMSTPTSSTGKRNVLIVALDPAVIRAFSDALDGSEYAAVAHGDLMNVPERARQVGAAAIVLDLGASGPQTLSLAGQLRTDPDARHVPILLHASAHDAPPLRRGLGGLVDDCFTAPFHPEEVSLRISAVDELARQRRQLVEHHDLRGEQTRMWNVLLDFARSMTRVMDIEDVFEQIVTTAAQLTCSRRVSLMLPDEGQEHLTMAHDIGVDDAVRASVRLPIGEAVAGKAFATGRLMTNETRGGDGDDSYCGDSFVSMPITTSCADITDHRVGVLNITNRFGDRPFEEWEIEFIDILGSVAGSVIDDTLWRRARESLLKFERDLQLARKIQQNSLPARLPDLPGYDLAAWSEPAEETGGDAYDMIGCAHPGAEETASPAEGTATRAVVLLADAVGHGVGPALAVTQVQAMLRMAVRTGSRLSTIVRNMNEQLLGDMPSGRFITAWFADVDAVSHTITSLSAGQAPILRYRAAEGAVDLLRTDTIPLGIDGELDLAEPTAHPMAVGDIVAAISDGVCEARNPSGECFGRHRLTDLIVANHDRPAAEILAAMRTALAAFSADAPADDDRTAVIVKRAG
jgi:phosphoserine phosphatase